MCVNVSNVAVSYQTYKRAKKKKKKQSMNTIKSKQNFNILNAVAK